MSAVVAFPTSAEYCLLETTVPRRVIGVLQIANGGVEDFRLLDDWSEFEDQEYLSELVHDFEVKIREMGGHRFLEWIEETLSGFLVVSEREPGRGRSLDQLFAEHVNPTVRPYETHLPVYSLRAAATKFGDEAEVEVESWRLVRGMRLTQGMFIAHVVGQSMEPLIPDGALCVFRAPVVGSRAGKKLLIEQFGMSQDSARYTVKRYTSKKDYEDGSWSHAEISLEPLNPAFDSFVLGPDDFRVVAEFIKVLE